MTFRSPILPENLNDALADVADKLENGAKLGAELQSALDIIGQLPPGQISQIDGAIAHSGRLYHRPPLSIFVGLTGRCTTDAAQLLRTPGLEHLFLFHRDGRMREAALNRISGPLPNPFAFAAVLWRLNDWAEPVRQAAMRCADRSFHRTEAAIVARTVAELLVRHATWGRWGNERAAFDSLLARTDVVDRLAKLVMTGATGPLASVLRYALRASTLDGYLLRIARDAVQPSVRAVAMTTLISGKAEWPSGTEWQWIDKPMGIRRTVTAFDRRSLAAPSPREELIDMGVRDKSATVRRAALDGVIRYLMGSPAGIDAANALIHDRSPSVRERAAFILRREAQ